MEKRKKELEIPKVGDEIILYTMYQDYTVRQGTKGTVTKIQQDPFESDNLLISVNWDNGSNLSLLSKYDAWKIAKKKLDESANQVDFFKKNPDFFKYFDRRFLREYVMKIRESGIINMFGSAPLLYAGKEHIDRYYGENPPNEEAFQEVLEMADESKNKMIQGTIKYLEANNKEVTVESVNHYIQKFAGQALNFFIIFL